jgi:hypothetical protein
MTTFTLLLFGFGYVGTMVIIFRAVLFFFFFFLLVLNNSSFLSIWEN